jgi:hypothetical protein
MSDRGSARNRLEVSRCLYVILSRNRYVVKRKFDYATTNSDDEICVLSRYRNMIEASSGGIRFNFDYEAVASLALDSLCYSLSEFSWLERKRILGSHFVGPC